MQAVSNAYSAHPILSAARKRMLRAAFAVVSMSIPIWFWILAALIRFRMSASALTRQSTASRMSSDCAWCSSASIIFLCFAGECVREERDICIDLVVVRRPSSCFCVIVLR